MKKPKRRQAAGRVAGFTDEERLRWVMDNAICYVYLDEEDRHRDLRSRQTIDNAMLAAGERPLWPKQQPKRKAARRG